NYGGEDGLLILARNQFSFNEINNGVNNGISIDTDNELIFFLICFILLIFILFISARMLHSRFGNALEVARMNDVRLATAGINPFPIKLTAFVFSAMIVGLSGALFADLNRFVSPSLMSWQMSGEIIIFILLGGVGRLFGPVLGATLFVLLETFIGGYTEHWKLFLGLVLLAIVLFGKGGLMQLLAGDKHHV
ncbi:MAG TPA: branched-chain amino acid ABC transporter permease, partial [Psychromonas hadalis]|nr:branched-chain amino acid ABC transporter permease [Psychromonas hadalis]